MDVVTSQSWRKWTKLIGCFFLLTPVGITWFWGNLSAYVTSYVIREDKGSVCDLIARPWFFIGYNVGCPVGTLISEWVMQRLGRRPSILLGAAICAAGCVLSYFIIDINPISMNIVLGGTFGVGGYIINGVLLTYFVEWADGDFGFINSVAQCGPPAGALVLNQLITFYINPDNLAPDAVLGPAVYFSQDEVLDNIPTVFLIIGAVVVGITVLSLPTIKNKSEKYSTGKTTNNDTKMACEDYNRNRDLLNGKVQEYDPPYKQIGHGDNGDVSRFYGSIYGNFSKTCTFNKFDMKNKSDEPSKEMKSFDIESMKDNSGVCGTQGSEIFHNFADINKKNEIHNKATPTPKTSSKTSGNRIPNSPSRNSIDEKITNEATVLNKTQKETNVSISEKTTEPPDKLSWRDLLRRPDYYYLSIVGIFGDATFVVLISYFKTYGQVYIRDDHFITNLSIAIVIAVVVSRWGWGKLIDRVGVKLTFMIHFSLTSVVSFCVYFSPMINKWCYVTATIAFPMTAAHILPLMETACYMTFGKPNVLLAFGLVLLPMTLNGFLLPYLQQAILDYRGWSYIYATCSLWNFLGLLFSIIFLPKKDQI